MLSGGVGFEMEMSTETRAPVKQITEFRAQIELFCIQTTISFSNKCQNESNASSRDTSVPQTCGRCKRKQRYETLRRTLDLSLGLTYPKNPMDPGNGPASVALSLAAHQLNDRPWLLLVLSPVYQAEATALVRRSTRTYIQSPPNPNVIHVIFVIYKHSLRPRADTTTVPQPGHPSRHIIIDKSQPSAIMKPLLADYTWLVPLTIFRRYGTMNDNQITNDFAQKTQLS